MSLSSRQARAAAAKRIMCCRGYGGILRDTERGNCRRPDTADSFGVFFIASTCKTSRLSPPPPPRKESGTLRFQEAH